jgi:hypothetical protein
MWLQKLAVFVQEENPWRWRQYCPSKRLQLRGLNEKYCLHVCYSFKDVNTGALKRLSRSVSSLWVPQLDARHASACLPSGKNPILVVEEVELCSSAGLYECREEKVFCLPPGFEPCTTCLWYFTLERSVESSWNVMAHGDARQGKWRGYWRMEWVASTLHTTSEHVVSSITTADAHTSAAISWLNWRPRQFKWTCPFRRKTKSGFCACAITFQTQSTNILY